MTVAKQLSPECQGLAMRGFGFSQLALPVKGVAQVVERFGDARVLVTKSFLSQRQRGAVHGLGFSIFAKVQVNSANRAAQLGLHFRLIPEVFSQAAGGSIQYFPEHFRVPS